MKRGLPQSANILAARGARRSGRPPTFGGSAGLFCGRYLPLVNAPVFSYSAHMLVTEKLPNGLTLLVEEIPHLESAAYDLLIPGGILTDQDGHEGACSVLAELSCRGAGNLDSKALSDAFDDAGIRHGEGAATDRFSYRGSLLADKLPLALSLVGQMVLDPALPEDEIESIQSLMLQDIRALEDSPARKAMMELGLRYYPHPYSRSSLGTIEGITAATAAHLRTEWERLYRPDGAILSIAGKVDPQSVIAEVKKHFSDWQGTAVELPAYGTPPKHEAFHIHSDSAQLQIALAYPSVKFGDPLYYAAKVASGLLSGGMFGRLFIEVREKRGLCYSVYCRHHATMDYGTVVAYAGTTPERAHETLDVMVNVLRSVAGTVGAEEFARAKANLKSSLVISEESAGARASSNCSDYWLLKRVRSIDEILTQIDNVTPAEVDQYFATYPADSFMLLTLGAKKLDLPQTK